MQFIPTAIALTLLVAVPSIEPVHFKLDQILIEGAPPRLMRLVKRRLKLKAGNTYPEASLKQAFSRIHRLPPIHDVYFQLEKGFQRGSYQLRITLRTRCNHISGHRPKPRSHN